MRLVLPRAGVTAPRRPLLLLSALGAVLFGLTLAGLSLHVPGAPNTGSVRLTNEFVALLGGAALAYLLAVHLVVRGNLPARGLWVVLGVALALRLPVLAAPAFLSSDAYRYVWDGRVQLHGINPYRYIPADPALAGLHDPAIYPHINRRTYAPTIYPPMAQLIFRAVATVHPSVRAIRFAMVGFEALAVACLLGLLRIAGLPPERVLIYAWNPLAVWAFAGNGHVDAAACGLVAAALLAFARRRAIATGGLLAAATLVKFLPLVLAPALWRPWSWRTPLAALLVALGLYGLYLDVGWRVVGFLGAYGKEEGLAKGGGFWLLSGLARLGPLPAWAGPLYVGAAGVVLLAVAAGCIAANRTRLAGAAHARRLCTQAGWLAACAMLAASPHYSWYFPWLAVFATVVPAGCFVWLSVAPLLFDLHPWHDDFLWRALVFVPALLLASRHLRRRASRNPASLDLDSLPGLTVSSTRTF